MLKAPALRRTRVRIREYCPGAARGDTVGPRSAAEEAPREAGAVDDDRGEPGHRLQHLPTWNSYPGLFASLVTGNAVVVKPHPRAVLPLAATSRSLLRPLQRAVAYHPQNLLVPRERTAEVGQGLAAALDRLLGDDARAVEMLGAVVNDDVRQRLEQRPPAADVIVASRQVKHPAFAEATVRTPLVLGLDAADAEICSAERFGPIAFLIGTDSTAASLDVWRRTATEHGALMPRCTPPTRRSSTLTDAAHVAGRIRVPVPPAGLIRPVKPATAAARIRQSRRADRRHPRGRARCSRGH